MSLGGKVAVITGASSGIGDALARVLASEGCRVGLLARRTDRLEALANILRHAGRTAEWAACDVTDRDGLRAAIGSLEERLGPTDLLIANAGVFRKTPPETLDVPGCELMVRVNLLGVMYAFEAVLPAMLGRGGGHLVAISSLAAYKGIPGSAGYCATKAAVNAYLESLRLDLRPRGVAVTAVCPGYVRSEMTAANAYRMPALLEADTAARLVVRAIKRRVAVFNFPLRTTLLVKAARWLPDWLVRRLAPKDPPGAARE
jgi:short-subunit dehydrogenase